MNHLKQFGVTISKSQLLIFTSTINQLNLTKLSMSHHPTLNTTIMINLLNNSTLMRQLLQSGPTTMNNHLFLSIITMKVLILTILTKNQLPTLNIYYYDEETNTYLYYAPTEAEWSYYYQEPTYSLYYYDQPTGDYLIDQEPSPYMSYYYYDEPTESYQYYEPSPVYWTDYYEAPSSDLYYYDEITNTYIYD